MINQKWKKKIQRGNIESIERNLNFKQRKNKSKKYTYPDYARTAVSVFFFIRSYKYPLQFYIISEGSIC